MLDIAFGHSNLINQQYPQNYTGDDRPVASPVRLPAQLFVLLLLRAVVQSDAVV